MAPFISLKTTPFISSSLSILFSSLNSSLCPSWKKSNLSKLGKKEESRYTLSKFLKSLSLSVAKGYAVQSLEVKAFINVFNDLLIIIKNGSLTGYFFEPHSAVCSSI